MSMNHVNGGQGIDLKKKKKSKRNHLSTQEVYKKNHLTSMGKTNRTGD
jgi:hypothetical protein